MDTQCSYGMAGPWGRVGIAFVYLTESPGRKVKYFSDIAAVILNTYGVVG